MANKLKRRFVELDVGEVSLVDYPANEEEFVVVKSLNMEEKNMADEIKEVTKAEEDKKADSDKEENEKKVEKVELKVENDSNSEVEKAMQKVTELVEGIVKAANGSTEKKEEEVKTEKKEDEKKEEIKTEKKEEEIKVENKVEETEEDKVNKTLELLEEGIKKARRFTPKREETLKNIVETLQNLLKDLTSSSDEPISKPSGSGQSFESGLNEVTKGIKELVEVVKKQNESAAETFKSLNVRLESIEKIRQPSKSVDEEGETDKEKQVEKSLWNGVL